MAQVFTDEERKAAAHLYELVMRQLSMGVPQQLAVGVLAAAAGSVAAHLGWKKEDLTTLVETMELGWEGQRQGAMQRETEASGG